MELRYARKANEAHLVLQQSIVASHDVAHASVRSRPEIWKVVRAAMRFGERDELTWLAN